MAVASFAQEQFLTAITRMRERGLQVRANQVPVVCRLPGTADVAALDRGLAGLVARHEILRLRFAVDADRVRAEVAGEGEVPVRWTIEPAPADDDATVARAWEVGFRPIEETSPALFQAVILQGDPAYLVLTLHHLIADDRSADLAVAELADHYARRPVPERAPSFLEYTREERARFADVDELDRLLSEAAVSLGGRPWLPALPEPLMPEPAACAIASPRRTGLLELLDPHDMRAFERKCFLARGTPFMGLLAAFGTAVRRVSGVHEIGIMVPYANRDDPRWEDCLGWFSSMSPCYLVVPEQGGFAEQLAAARAAVTAMMRRRRVPLALALRHMSPADFHGEGHARPGCVFSFWDSRAAARTPEVAWQRLRSPQTSSTSYTLWLERSELGLGGVVSGPGGGIFDDIEAFMAHTLRRWSRSPD